MPRFEPDRIIAALNQAGVRYVVVGGLAVGAHGVVRATRDLDLVPDPAAPNLDALATVLRGLGATHPVSGELTGAALARPVAFKVGTRHGDVQVLNRMSAVPAFAELHEREVLVELGDGGLAPVCSLRDLVSMKRASGRPRDLVDVAELSELHGMAD